MRCMVFDHLEMKGGFITGGILQLEMEFFVNLRQLQLTCRLAA